MVVVLFIGDSHLFFAAADFIKSAFSQVFNFFIHVLAAERTNIILIYEISSFEDGERIEHSVHLPLIAEVPSTVIEEERERNG